MHIYHLHITHHPILAEINANSWRLINEAEVYLFVLVKMLQKVDKRVDYGAW